MGNTIPPHIEICDICRHYQGMKLIEVGEGIEADFVNTCSAFPDGEGVPDEILLGENIHTEPYPGDNGIQFESVEEE